MSDLSRLAEGDAVVAAERERFLAEEELKASRTRFLMLNRSARWVLLTAVTLTVVSLCASLAGLSFLRLVSIPGSVATLAGVYLMVLSMRAYRRLSRARERQVEIVDRYRQTVWTPGS
ncbi:hypothetical protein [Leifsonia sp. Leaf264]|uniref:hypothetical protein n=1 Tax=Leifsonia sp. Leaf264 TaxID=1736314 RepID=UPI0006F2D0D0|nr:hypothetical protein [Leifsonia sp. Leaf264]KQO98270.1 hypothetical protein ASF30_09420 [Leifsonia sp. Leaf264]